MPAVGGGSPPACPGVYVLVLRLARQASVRAGRLAISVPPGLLLYVGSARGPGGLAARLARHLRGRGRRSLHWHIDRLIVLHGAEPLGAAYACTALPLEPRVARACLEAGLEPVEGFGSSDDPGVPGHLYRAPGSLSGAVRAAEGCLEAVGLEPRWLPSRI